MHPRVRRDLQVHRQLDHVHGRRVSPFLARAAFERRLELPDRCVARTMDGLERDAGLGFWHLTCNQPYSRQSRQAIIFRLAALFLLCRLSMEIDKSDSQAT